MNLFYVNQVCRLAYELMQALHGDATDMVKSLDYPFFFAPRRPLTVTMNHTAFTQNELDLQVHV